MEMVLDLKKKNKAKLQIKIWKGVWRKTDRNQQ